MDSTLTTRVGMVTRGGGRVGTPSEPRSRHRERHHGSRCRTATPDAQTHATCPAMRAGRGSGVIETSNVPYRFDAIANSFRLALKLKSPIRVLTSLTLPSTPKIS